jgi:hypothetical protein
MTANDGITAITLTTDEGSVTVSPEAFDRYAASLKRGGTMTSAATATRPAIHVRVPMTDDFDGEEFLLSDELQALYDQLIRDYPDTHGHLPRVAVKVAWKAKGGKSQGKVRLGYCAKLSGAAKFFAEAEFLIWLAADTVMDRELTDSQIRAAVSHEMRHIAWQDGEDGEDGKAVIAGHDAEIFFSEIHELGAWEEFISEAAQAFSQAGLL